MQRPPPRSLLIGAAFAAAALLGGCATPPPPAEAPRGFTLVSPGRADNEMLARKHAGRNPNNPNCAGDNVSPALAWARPPAGTKSYVLLLDDQAGRNGLGVSHWVAYGIPADVTGFAEGEASAPSSKFVGGRNLPGTGTWYGPCPPRGNAPQHYVLTLIATSLEPTALAPGLTKPQLLEALQGKTLGAASFVFRYAH